MQNNNWKKIQPFGKESYTYWVNGIYKIVSYYDNEFLAFYIKDSEKNWGDYIETPPDSGKYGKIWNNLGKAIKACEKHAQYYQPKEKTKERAKELLEYFEWQEKDFLNKGKRSQCK